MTTWFPQPPSRPAPAGIRGWHRPRVSTAARRRPTGDPPTPAVGATTSCGTTPRCSRTGLTVGGFSGTVITSGGRWRWGRFGCTPAPARFGIVVLQLPGRPPVAECHLRVPCPAPEGQGCNQSGCSTEVPAASRPDPTSSTDGYRCWSRAAAAAVLDVAVGRGEPLERASADVAVGAAAVVRRARTAARIGDRHGRAGPAYQKTCDHTILAARRRFAWVTVPLLRVAKTYRRVDIGFCTPRLPAGTASNTRANLR